LISHHRQDADRVARVASELARAGVTGRGLAHVGTAGIGEASAVVVVVGSPAAANTSWIGYEVGMSHALDKPVIAMAPDTLPMDDLPDELRDETVRPFDPTHPETAARRVARELLAAD
jgi:hypothetical protein